MAQSLTQVYLHLVFSTKARQPLLNSAEMRARTHTYLAGICRNLRSPALIIGGVEDHAHMLCRLGKTLSIAELVKEIKHSSSVWIKEQYPALATFYWQAGYGAFSVGPEAVEDLRAYIAGQERHHREETFPDEFRRLLRAHGVQWDERYVWD